MTPQRNFEPTVRWTDDEGLLTERAKGYLRGLFDYIGATAGAIPTSSLGGNGTSTTTFLREDGNWSVPAYPVGASPTASVGTAAVVGTATTFLRSDAAPALSLSITPTWTGAHTFSAAVTALTLKATTGFGCNSKTPQTAATIGAAVVTTAATNVVPYGFATAAQADDLVTRVNTIRAALVANGILV